MTTESLTQAIHEEAQTADPAWTAAKEAAIAAGGLRAFDMVNGMQAWELALDSARRALTADGHLDSGDSVTSEQDNLIAVMLANGWALIDHVPQRPGILAGARVHHLVQTSASAHAKGTATVAAVLRHRTEERPDWWIQKYGRPSIEVLVKVDTPSGSSAYRWWPDHGVVETDPPRLIACTVKRILQPGGVLLRPRRRHVRPCVLPRPRRRAQRRNTRGSAPMRAKYAAAIRAGILAAKHTDYGSEDDPYYRIRSQIIWSGQPTELRKLTLKAFNAHWEKIVQRLLSSMTHEEARAAKKAFEKAFTVFSESRAEREMRLLREEVERMRARLAEVGV